MEQRKYCFGFSSEMKDSYFLKIKQIVEHFRPYFNYSYSFNNTVYCLRIVRINRSKKTLTHFACCVLLKQNDILIIRT